MLISAQRSAYFLFFVEMLIHIIMERLLFFYHQREMNLADEQTETKLLVINLPIGISNKNVDVYDRLLVSFRKKIIPDGLDIKPITILILID